MQPTSFAERLTAAESDLLHLYRAQGVHEERHREHDDAHRLIDGKLDDLSGQVRALDHEVRTEVVPRLDRIEADVAELKRGVGALLDHFQITLPPAD